MRSVNDAAFFKLVEGVTDDLTIDAKEAEFLQRQQDPSWTDAFIQQQLKQDHAKAVAANDSRAITELYTKMGGSVAAYERTTVEQETAFRAYALEQFDAFAKTTVGQPGELKNYSYLGELSTLRGLNEQTDDDDDGW